MSQDSLLSTEVSKDRLITMLRQMMILRRASEEVILLRKEGLFPGPFHVYIGQEATAVGVAGSLTADDRLFPTHRNIGHVLARGADLELVLAEILGKETGYNRGRAGPMHVSPVELGILRASAIVGGAVALATGAALALSRQSLNGISVCFFGDGTLEEGIFYEAVNMAALWSLPVLFICENNSFGALGRKAGERPASTIKAKELTDVVQPFSIPTWVVDGADVCQVFRVVASAVDRVRAGSGPCFIEARTVRWPGAKLGEPDLVTGLTDISMAWDRSKIPEKEQGWFERDDPVLRLTRELLGEGLLTCDRILALDEEIQAQVRDASGRAKKSPYPQQEGALENVFVKR